MATAGNTLKLFRLQWVSPFVVPLCLLSVSCTHVDDRVLELDVEPVVGNGNNGFIGMTKIFHPFPLKNWEWHLQKHRNNQIVKAAAAKTLHNHLFIVKLYYVCRLCQHSYSNRLHGAIAAAVWAAASVHCCFQLNANIKKNFGVDIWKHQCSTLALDVNIQTFANDITISLLAQIRVGTLSFHRYISLILHIFCIYVTHSTHRRLCLGNVIIVYFDQQGALSLYCW